MNKFKVGDIITGISPVSDDKYYITNSSAIMEVIRIVDSNFIKVKILESIHTREKGNTFEVESSYFKIKENIKFDDIKSGDIITLRNGDRLYVDKDFDLIDLDDCSNHATNLHVDFDNYKSIDYSIDEDIVKVERISSFDVIYKEIKKELKEMTLKEVCEELGYEIKIIKEKEGNK